MSRNKGAHTFVMTWLVNRRNGRPDNRYADNSSLITIKYEGN
jgi:hypothetical protein